MVNNKSILIFGAGKIGRSFIGQLFSQSGYRVIFIDNNQRVINELNQHKTYKVVIKGKDEKTIKISNVIGILAKNYESIINAIANCDIMATSVGENAFRKIIPLIAQGIEKRRIIQPNFPIDIILAENIRNADEIMRNGLKLYLPKSFPINSYIGLIETSIGKMVPIMSKEVENKDALLVYAESYNTLILGKSGFKNPIPNVKGLSPKENIKAWVDRKAFIHNLGHVAAAYFGFYKFPGRKYIFEVLDDDEVYTFTRAVMKQSAKALIKEYPAEFTFVDLVTHIDDLISRFRNQELGDTVFRVGRDLRRKLSKDDRVIGAVRLASKHHLPYHLIIKVLAYGFFFSAENESGHPDQGDEEFLCELKADLDNLLISVCGLNSPSDIEIINKIKSNL
jgi:mannitol-1-phosphate 5-dehydrogenase